nr:hypothetical protein CFP56_12991 [Quercus suber]
MLTSLKALLLRHDAEHGDYALLCLIHLSSSAQLGLVLTSRFSQYSNSLAGKEASFGGLSYSKVVTMKPGTAFALQLTIGEGFDRFKSQGVRIVVVAPDRSQHMVARQWWSTNENKTEEVKYNFLDKPMTANRDWHKHVTESLADSGCVTVWRTPSCHPGSPLRTDTEHEWVALYEYRNLRQ